MSICSWIYDRVVEGDRGGGWIGDVSVIFGRWECWSDCKTLRRSKSLV